MAARTRWLVLLAVALAGLLYLPSLRYGFVWDDVALVVENPDLKLASPLPLFGRSFMQHQSAQELRPDKYYRPLVVASLWLDARIWGLRPFGFHLTNMVLNVTAGLLAALLLLRLFPGRLWPPLLAGLGFALHPAHVESVAFVSGRTDVLAAVFVLGSALALASHADRPAWWRLGLGLLLFAAALFSKEATALLPVLVLLLLPGPGRRRLLLFGLMAVVTATWLLLRSAVLEGYVPALSGIDLITRFMLLLNALGRYAVLSVFPFFHRLLYPDAAAFAGFGWPTLTGIAVLVGLALLIWKHRARPLGWGCAWFLAFILPVCNLFPMGFSLLSERLLYLPVLGAGVVAADLLGRARGTVPVAASCVCLALFGWNALARMPVWQNQLSLYRRMAADAPGSADAHNNLGFALSQAGDRAAAEDEFRRALALRPDLAGAHTNLGDVLKARGDTATAEVEYLRAVAALPTDVGARNALGILYGRRGRFDSAAAQFRAVLALKPGLAEAWVNLGNALALSGQPDSAETALLRALEIDPGLVEARANLEKLRAWRRRTRP